MCTDLIANIWLDNVHCNQLLLETRLIITVMYVTDKRDVNWHIVLLMSVKILIDHQYGLKKDNGMCI